MGRRCGDTFLTEEQVSILKMRNTGMTLDEIAKALGVSKASVHAVLRNAYKTVERARKTLRLYAEITGGVTVTSGPGTRAIELIDKLFKEADIHGIKLSVRSVEILLKVIKELPECIDIKRGVITCNIKITILTDGRIEVSRQ